VPRDLLLAARSALAECEARRQALRHQLQAQRERWAAAREAHVERVAAREGG